MGIACRDWLDYLSLRGHATVHPQSHANDPRENDGNNDNDNSYNNKKIIIIRVIVIILMIIITTKTKETRLLYVVL